MVALAYCGYSYAFPWGRTLPFTPSALGVNTGLFTVFALHHSLFAREAVKHWVSRLVPGALVRSMYVWLASLLLIAVCAAWRPVGGDIYHHTGVLAVVHGVLQLAGAAIIFQTVRLIDPLELAGIRLHPDTESLQIVGPFRWVRHPIYAGWLLLTFGAAHMTGEPAVLRRNFDAVFADRDAVRGTFASEELRGGVRRVPAASALPVDPLRVLKTAYRLNRASSSSSFAFAEVAPAAVPCCRNTIECCDGMSNFVLHDLQMTESSMRIM